MSSSTPPIYSVGDTIYLLASANKGNLESYQIDGILWDDRTSQWAYIINIKRSASPTGQENALGFGVRPDKYTLMFRESEVLDFCDAAVIVHRHYTLKLEAINAMIAGRCSETGTG
jgi:hypothetical protein